MPLMKLNLILLGRLEPEWTVRGSNFIRVNISFSILKRPDRLCGRGYSGYFRGGKATRT